MNHAADEKVTFLRMGDVTLEEYENKKAAMAPGALDDIALNVMDIGKAFQKAKEQGVKFFTVLEPNEEKVELSQYL